MGVPLHVLIEVGQRGHVPVFLPGSPGPTGNCVRGDPKPFVGFHDMAVTSCSSALVISGNHDGKQGFQAGYFLDRILSSSLPSNRRLIATASHHATDLHNVDTVAEPGEI